MLTVFQIKVSYELWDTFFNSVDDRDVDKFFNSSLNSDLRIFYSSFPNEKNYEKQ